MECSWQVAVVDGIIDWQVAFDEMRLWRFGLNEMLFYEPSLTRRRIVNCLFQGLQALAGNQR